MGIIDYLQKTFAYVVTKKIIHAFLITWLIVYILYTFPGISLKNALNILKRSTVS